MTGDNSAIDPVSQETYAREQRTMDAVQAHTNDALALHDEQIMAARQMRPQPTRTLEPLLQVVDANNKGVSR